MQSVAEHELGFTVVAALAFLLIAPLGAILRKAFNSDSAWTLLAAVFFEVDSCLLVAGQLVQIGTQRAILPVNMVEIQDPAMLGLIWDMGLMISNWLENGGYFSLALGMIGWAVAGPGRAWAAQLEDPVGRAGGIALFGGDRAGARNMGNL